MTEKTKLQHETNRRLRLFVCIVVLESLIVMTGCFIKENVIGMPLNNRDICWITGVDLITFLVFIGYLLSANDNYRVCKEETVRTEGQMPFSKTYYKVQHRVFWWKDCRNSKGKTIRFKHKKDADRLMAEKIKEWTLRTNTKPSLDKTRK